MKIGIFLSALVAIALLAILNRKFLAFAPVAGSFAYLIGVIIGKTWVTELGLSICICWTFLSAVMILNWMRDENKVKLSKIFGGLW